ncbi:MAG: GerMN domain-containing protein [Desulfuromonadales bacterium]|nr:GerMN domain-containing protein [Desulfuromonadales bacterium]
MPKTNHKPSKFQRRPLRKRLILFGCLVVLVFSVGLLVGYFKTREAPRVEPVAMDTSAQLSRDVVLYFASADGQTLVAETRKINECQIDEDCLRDTVEALIAGPESGFAPILSTQVRLLGITVVDSLVTIDFSQEMIAAHPGGTQSELLTIYGLVDTLAVNFPHLRQAQFLVEGAPVSTLKGHVDLRQPINPDFTLVEEGLAPVGKMNSLPAGRE